MEGSLSSVSRRASRSRIALFLIGTLLFIPFFIPDPLPPFKFLKKANLRYMQVNSGSSGRLATYSYLIDGDPEHIAKQAGQELNGWNHLKSSSFDSDEFRRGDELIDVVGWNFGSKDHPMTYVLYDRPAGFLDELRSPIHHIGSWLP